VCTNCVVMNDLPTAYTLSCLLMTLVCKVWLTVFIITASETNSLLHGLFHSGNTLYWFLLISVLSSVEFKTLEMFACIMCYSGMHCGVSWE